MRNCREKPKVPMIVSIPKIERAEAQRSTMAKAFSCSAESVIVELGRWRRHQLLHVTTVEFEASRTDILRKGTSEKRR